MAARYERGAGERTVLTTIAESPEGSPRPGLTVADDGVIPFKPREDPPDLQRDPGPGTGRDPVRLAAPAPPPAVLDAIVRPFARGVDVLVERGLRLAASPPALPRVDVAPLARAMRASGPPLLVLFGIVVLVSLAVLTRATWMPAFRGAAPPPVAAVTLPPVTAAPKGRALPPEVQEAIAALPHLAPDTVEALMARDTGRRAPEPAEVFRQAHLAVVRGRTILTEDEAEELRLLHRAVLGALPRVDRDRVRAYDRLSPVRDLLVDEDARVMALFTRGARALPAARRERLQLLLGKAIAGGRGESARLGAADPVQTGTQAPRP